MRAIPFSCSGHPEALPPHAWHAPCSPRRSPAALSRGHYRCHIAEGVALHDQGDYDGAITKYREVLAADPDNTEALYEISYAQVAKGDYTGCIKTAEGALKKAKELRALLFTTLGSCWDLAGQPKKAIKTLEKGLREAPRDSGLLFNLAVVQLNSGKKAESRNSLERTLAEEPRHRTANLALGDLYQAEGKRVAAVLAYLRFLTLELETARAKAAAEATRGLLLAGVTDEGGGKITLLLSPPKKGDALAALDFMMGLAAASQHTEDQEKKSEAERLVHVVAQALAMVGESMTHKDNCFPCRVQLPALLELKQAEQLEAFAHLAFAPLKIPGSAEWLAANGTKVEAAKLWLAAANRR